MLSEISRQRKTNAILFHSYVESIFKNEQTKENKNKHRYREQISGYQRGRVLGVGRWVKGVNCMVLDGN